MTNADDPINAIFGTADEPTANIEFEGLTKREYFAAMAMQGLISNGMYHAKTYEQAMQEAVANADALIEALNK